MHEVRAARVASDRTQTAQPTLRKIGDAAERTGLSLRTVRYWEEVGLVTPSARTRGGFRLYSESDIQRLLVVKWMKPLELTLEEMRELLELLEGPLRLARTEYREKLRAYGERAEERIGKLERYLEQARDLRQLIAERMEPR